MKDKNDKHKMTVRVDRDVFEVARRRGIMPQPAAELGLKILTYLSHEELEVLRELVDERMNETVELMQRMTAVAPVDLKAEGNQNVKNVVIRMLYREYKDTLEFPTESIQRAAAQKGIDAVELQDELYEMIWGSNDERDKRRTESPVKGHGL